MSVRPEVSAESISILCPDDRILELPLTPTTKVADIKQAIFDQTRLKPQFQIILFGGKILNDDEQELVELGVSDQDMLKLQQIYDESHNSIRVVVNSGSQSREIRCIPSSSVESFHRLVAEQFKGRSSLDLEYDGVQLERGKSLIEYGLQDGAHVRLIEQLKGGSK